MNDEADYFRHAEVAFRRIDDALCDVDVDLVDCERSGDVLTLTFGSGKRCVVNTQRPTQQIWVAASSRGWHFRFDGAEWIDERNDASINASIHASIDASLDASLDAKPLTNTLFSTLQSIVKEHANVDISF